MYRIGAGIVNKNCPVNGCDEQLEKSWNLCCKSHWFALPKPLRDEVWRLYKAERGSSTHLDAIAECLIYLNGLEKAS